MSETANTAGFGWTPQCPGFVAEVDNPGYAAQLASLRFDPLRCRIRLRASWECQNFRVRAGIAGYKGSPLCLDANTPRYRMSFDQLLAGVPRAQLLIQAVCWIH
ncbi:hypothetical protein NKJ64_22020 [Mesorhizobium sp. M0062]|uniref:hypothetical protein n=1 Tax=Mesorhizobium sp. M0062 TaxID=2956867 RepID=UPI0033354B39